MAWWMEVGRGVWFWAIEVGVTPSSGIGAMSHTPNGVENKREK